jgi:glycosyltransferase involved in cell wall biosynthesis
MDLVTIVIPTYNRFNYVLDTIESVNKQTYTNIEIIVVNDKSTQQEYYTYNWKNHNIKIIHLEKNSRDLFGYACAGYVRNKGVEVALGKYIAFCDDDDIWYPEKLEKQIAAMKQFYCKISCTEAHIGNGRYIETNNYKLYLKEFYYDCIKNKFKKANSNLLNNGFPVIWDANIINIINTIICSSVVVEKELLNKIGNMPLLRNSEEDIGCWRHILQYTGCYFVPEACLYYDNGHGDGQQY